MFEPRALVLIFLVVVIIAVATPSRDCGCDYSLKFGYSHTMNKYSEAPSRACGAYKKRWVTHDEKKTILKTHNDRREKVARGLERDGYPGPQPGATNMFELKWNCELAEVAQRWAERCKFSKNHHHDKGKDRKICNQHYSVGQNKYTRWGPYTESDWEGAITEWYSEVENMTSSLVDRFRFKWETGHYTQLVWADTYEVGCGVIHFPDPYYGAEQVYVCNYGPAGNGRSPVYEIGSSASNCPYGASYDYPGLCAPPS